MARLLVVLVVSVFLVLGVEALPRSASAQPAGAPDPRDAALQLSDLAGGFALVDEEPPGDRSLPTYAATWLQRDTAQIARDGLLVVIAEDITSVGGADTPSPDIVQVLTRQWVETMRRRSRFPVSGDPELVAGPRVGDDSQWISARVPIGTFSADAYVVAFRARRFVGVIEGMFVEGTAGKPTVFRLAEIMKSRLALLQGYDAPALLMRDDFTGAGDGPVFCTASGAAAGLFQISYLDGECSVRPLTTIGASTYLPTLIELADTSAGVDIRLIGIAAGYQVGISCRDTVQGETRTPGYELLLTPSEGAFTLKGFNKLPPAPNLPGTAIITLAEGTSPAIQAGDGINHLGLVCSGTMISASVNGVQLASVEDAQTAMGSMSLRVVPNSNEGEVRFGNLVVMRP